MTRAHRRRRYALVQVHTLPDFLVAAALPLRLAGVPVLLDLHEAMPEFFRSRFPRAANPVAYALLRLQERVSIGLASAAVTVNAAMRERLVGLGVRPDEGRRWSPTARRSPGSTRPGTSRAPFAADGTVRLVYAGALTPTYELDVVLEALALIAQRRPELDVRARRLRPRRRRRAARRAGDRTSASTSASRSTAGSRSRMCPAAVARADIGVAPTRRDPFTDVSLSTKVFEYGAMGKPVVASRLPMVERTFPPGSVATYDPGDPASMAAAILSFVDDAAARGDAVERTAEIVAGIGLGDGGRALHRARRSAGGRLPGERDRTSTPREPARSGRVRYDTGPVRSP